MKKKLLFWILLFGFALPAVGSAEERWLPLPPASIGEWYKPKNERQVWLHTMFALRREMQAVAEYAASGDRDLLQKWGARFVAHYRKIAEMVPEWRDELDYEGLQQLQDAVDQGDPERVAAALKTIGRSCSSCHREFRATTAMIYRTPDFGKIRVQGGSGEPARDYPEVMQELSALVNRIKIASDDARHEAGLVALAQLNRRLDQLASSCGECHRDAPPESRILGELTREALAGLEQGLKQGDQKLAGRSLGSAAVYACARCHAIHRAPYDMRERLLR
ncbi:MAG: cytochrome c [Sedimenticola sp.]|nr:cytochrome c [Sedimenticola sp.]